MNIITTTTSTAYCTHTCTMYYMKHEAHRVLPPSSSSHQTVVKPPSVDNSLQEIVPHTVEWLMPIVILTMNLVLYCLHVLINTVIEAGLSYLPVCINNYISKNHSIAQERRITHWVWSANVALL